MNTRLIYPLTFLLLLACNSSGPEKPVLTTTDSEKYVNPAVITGPLQKRSISRKIKCTGRIEIPPTDIISIHARTSGQVTNIRYLPGDYVEKGALLLRIVNPGLIEKQRRLLETKADLQLALSNFNRQETLAAGSATTAEKLDASRSRLEMLRATYTGLENELVQYGVNVNRLETTGEFQSSFGVYAPQNAFVHEVHMNQGKMITPNDELMQLASTQQIYLELQVPAHQMVHLRKGQEVKYITPYDGNTGMATIRSINPMVEEKTSALQVYCRLEDKTNRSLIPGMFINATILTTPREVTGLPRDAVVKEGEDYFGFRVLGEKYEKTALQEVSNMDDFVSFTGTQDGEWVTGGAYYLEKGE